MRPHRKIQLTTKDSAEVRFPVSITDSNVYDYFDRDTFKLRRQTDTIKNQIEFWFTEKYSKGTVNVSNGSNIVVGYGGVPETECDGLRPFREVTPGDGRGFTFAIAGAIDVQHSVLVD